MHSAGFFIVKICGNLQHNRAFALVIQDVLHRVQLVAASCYGFSATSLCP